MKTLLPAVQCLFWLIATNASAGSIPPRFATLLHDHCAQCHDAESTTDLNLVDIPYDLADPTTFRKWVSIFDRLRNGEMPPAAESQPDSQQVKFLLDALAGDLRSANLESRSRTGRVPARRLTRREYDYTVRDLLSISGDFATHLPEESDTGSFDTVGTSQRISALHLQGYLAAGDQVFEEATRSTVDAYRSFDFDLLNSEHLNAFHEKEVRLGGNISRKLNDGVALFADVDYLLRSDLHGFKVRTSGIYRIRLTAQAFQSQQPVALKVVVKDRDGQTQLVGACDLLPGRSHDFEVKTYLTRNKVFYVAMVQERPRDRILFDIITVGGAANYQGAGIAVKSLHVEGPLAGNGPPNSIREILSKGPKAITQTNDGTGQIEISKLEIAHVRKVVSRLAPRAFRRPLVEGESDALVSLAIPVVDDKRPLVDAIRIPFRAVLSSPQFLFLTGQPGPLDDYALASRLSYFLWKSLPDDQLLALAEQAALSDPEVLSQQVDRMLNDDRSQRFVRDFTGQWLRLNELDTSAPDEKLYPEYDDLLHWSIPQETQSFFQNLIKKDLSVGNFIDSNHVFVNRRLASHYGLEGVVGQHIREVPLPSNHPRGGLLTHASILKVTADGVTTSPVTRGNFVLANLMGTPPPPPPADVGFIEPDTSGATTIRESLERHREIEACAQCHQQIDPPGFALECFDPIGGYRTRYRASVEDNYPFVTYRDGPPVDSSGITKDGKTFSGIQEYKQHLFQEQEQLAKNFISQLIVYSTGAEIQFADRDAVEMILNRTRGQGFPVRTIIHEVVQSELFRNR